MKNEDQHIDKLFQALKADTFKAPASFLDDLKLRMDAKVARKKKFVFWYSILGLAVLGIISVVLFTHYSGMNSCETIALNDRINIENNDLADSNSSTKVKPTVQKQFEHKRSIRFGYEHNSLTKNKPKLKHDSSNSGIKNRDFNFKSSTSGGVTNKSKSYQKSSVGSTNNGFVEKNNTNSSKSNSNAPADKTIDGSINNSVPNVGTPNSATSQKNNSFLDEGSITTINASEENPIQKAAKSQDEVMRVSTLKLKTPTFENEQYNLLKNKNLLPTNPELFEKRIAANWEFDAQLYGGAMVTTSKFNPAFDGTNASDFTYNKPISPAYGVRANVFYKNISASLGAEYNKTSDNISFITSKYEQLGIDSTFLGFELDTIWTQWPDSLTFVTIEVPIYDTTAIIGTIDTQNKIKNSYSWISIPVSFGYRFNVGSWAVIPAVGINLNFGVASNSGEYPAGITTKAKYDAVKFNTDIRIQTEVRKVFGNYYVFATPYFRKNLQPVISNPNLRINQSNWGLNVGAGIRF